MNKTKTIILFTVMIFIFSIFSVTYADELQIEKIEDKFLYDMTGKMKQSDVEHIEKLSSAMAEQAGVNFTLVLTEGQSDIEALKESIVTNWNLDTGKNILYIINDVGNGMRSTIYKSTGTELLNLNSIHNISYSYGAKEFHSGNISSGVLYAYNNLYKSFAPFYNVKIDGIDFEKLPIENSKVIYYVIIGVLSIGVIVFVFFFAGDNKAFKARTTRIGKTNIPK